jgi:SAM-dependent methyltransferase
MSSEAAREFVGTDEQSGLLQLAVLWSEGLRTHHDLLEIGCGALHLAIPAANWLKYGNYVGIDPNAWLRDEEEAATDLMAKRGARFLSNSDFDASSLDRKFNFVFAHSVLSHASDKQLAQFFSATIPVLKPGGKILFSLRFGGPSHAEDWVYPDVTYFSWPQVRDLAPMFGLRAERHCWLRDFYTAFKPQEFHDWVVVQ